MFYLAMSSLVKADEFAVGDLVRVEFMGKEFESEIAEVKSNGWLRIEVEFMGRTRLRTFPPSKVTKIKDAFETEDAVYEFRTWKDATGNFSVKAKLIEFDDENVKIEKEDGRVVSIPIEKISEDDLTYLAGLEDRAVMEDPDNPFAGGTRPKETEESFDDADGFDLDFKRGSRRNRSKTKSASYSRIDTSANPIALAANDWNVEPDGQIREATLKGKRANFPRSNAEHTFHNDERFLISNSNLPLCALSRSNPFLDHSELFLVRMSDSKLIAQIRIPAEKTNLLALSPNGNSLVTISDARGHRSGRMSLWKIDGRKMKNAGNWDPDNLFRITALDAPQAFFVDDRKLLLLGKPVVLLDCDSGDTIYSFDRKPGQVAVSSGQKLVGVVSNSSIFVIETESGETKGQIDEPYQGVDALAFSNDGKKLAGLNKSSGCIWIWDMVSGELANELSVSPDTVRTNLQWIDDQFLLVGNKHLVDTISRSKVWEFSISRKGVKKSNGKYWKLDDGRLSQSNIGPVNLANKTRQFEPDELLVLSPGSKIALEISGKLPFDRTTVADIKESLAEELKENKFVLDDDASLKLRLSVTKGEKETTEYRDFLDPPWSKGKKATYTPTVCKIELVKEGRTFWHLRQTFTAGHFIHLRENESVQAAAKRVCKPNSTFFTKAKLPRYYAELPGGKLLGESKL